MHMLDDTPQSAEMSQLVLCDVDSNHSSEVIQSANEISHEQKHEIKELDTTIHLFIDSAQMENKSMCSPVLHRRRHRKNMYALCFLYNYTTIYYILKKTNSFCMGIDSDIYAFNILSRHECSRKSGMLKLFCDKYKCFDRTNFFKMNWYHCANCMYIHLYWLIEFTTKKINYLLEQMSKQQLIDIYNSFHAPLYKHNNLNSDILIRNILFCMTYVLKNN